MIIHTSLIVVLLGHVLGDFYFQPNTMAENKFGRIKWLLVHGIVYILCMAIILFLFVRYSHGLLFLFLTVNLSHVTIDFLTRFLKWKRFIIDQLAHLAVIFTSWMIWGGELMLNEHIALQTIIMDKSVIPVVLGLLCILKPVGILIEQGDVWSFDKIKSPLSEVHRGTGKMIGYLERIIVYFLLLKGQYTAIAFVITAKSVARFPEIGKEGEGRSQAEYYLIGTLLSMVSVFTITLLLGLI